MVSAACRRHVSSVTEFACSSEQGAYTAGSPAAVGAILAGQFLSELPEKERPSPSRFGVGGRGWHSPCKSSIVLNCWQREGLGPKTGRTPEKKINYSEDSGSISHRNVRNCLSSAQFTVIQRDSTDIHRSENFTSPRWSPRLSVFAVRCTADAETHASLILELSSTRGSALPRRMDGRHTPGGPNIR
jgi:hypothetical protein